MAAILQKTFSNSNENHCICIQIPLKSILKGPIDNMSSNQLVQIMAWCHQAMSHYQNQRWQTLCLYMASPYRNELSMALHSEHQWINQAVQTPYHFVVMPYIHWHLWDTTTYWYCLLTDRSVVFSCAISLMHLDGAVLRNCFPVHMQ